MREAKISQNQSVEASLKAFDVSSNKSQLDHTTSRGIFCKAVIQVLYDLGFIKKICNKQGVLKG